MEINVKAIGVICAVAIVGLSACGPTVASKEPVSISAKAISTHKQFIASKMKDPSSAQFRNIRGVRTTTTAGTWEDYVCGEVNGRNSYGGYSGFSPFVYVPTTGVLRISDSPDSLAAYYYGLVC